MATHDLGEHDFVDILAMGDFHIGDKHADLMMVHDAMSWLLEEENRYGVIAGDVLNMATRASVSFDYGDISPKEARIQATQILGRAAHKIKAVVFGNHDYRANKEIGIDALEWVCTELGIPYYDAEAVVKFQVGSYDYISAKKRHPVNYIGYMAHGCRGGRTVGGKVNGLMDYRQVLPNADFYIGGHGHEPVIKPDGCFMANRQHGSIIQHDQMFISCGASLDRKLGSGYAARFIYRPLAKVFPILRLDGHDQKMTARTGD